MTDGIGYPKFYIYDSTGTTLQSIPENVGTAGVISLSKNVSATNLEPERLAIFHEDLPYTHASLEEWLGYRYRASLTITKGSYHSTLLQYAADQANPSYANDIYKMRCVQAYADAGYKIKFTPHNDLEDVWGTIFPVWVNLRQTGRGRLQTLRSDVHQYEIIGSELLSTAEAFYAFSFTHLNGVTNANQCLSLNGSSEYGSATAFDIGTSHTIEWVCKGVTFGPNNRIYFESTAGASYIIIGSTNITYQAQGVSVNVAHGATGSNRNLFFIVRLETSVSFYVNGSLAGSTQTLASNPTGKVNQVFAQTSGAAYSDGKWGYVRIYQSARTAAEARMQYNSGYGNFPINVSAYAIWEFNGTGGTGTASETDQSGNSRTLTLVDTPTRTTW